MNYFKILRFLQYGDKGLFDVSIEDQRAFLNKLDMPEDDIDRSYNQYQCQNYFVSRRKQVLFDVVSVFALPFLVVFLLIKRIGNRKGQSVEAIFESMNMLEIVPTELYDKYAFAEECWDVKPSLSVRDLAYGWRIYKKAPLHCYFTLKSLINVARYSALIWKYTPRVIIRHSEYSFSSSLLTEYCHQHHVKHINVMHGEKLFFIRDAYFHFDECYVWSEHYAMLFKSLKAEPNQFKIAIPPSMKINVDQHQNPNVYADYKYYLAQYSEEQLRSIVKSLRFVIQQGKSVKYRPHPRYSNMDILKDYVSEEEIEYPQYVSILESISNMEYAVGSYTTVLSQAWFSGKNIILDDVTFKDQYEHLEELSYSLIGEHCLRLSELNSKNNETVD